MRNPTDFDRLLESHREVYRTGYREARDPVSMESRRPEFGVDTDALAPALAASYWLGFHERARGCRG